MIRSCLLAALFFMAAPAVAQTADPVTLADPFVGADGGGNTVPGAGVPFGFVSLSPDTANGETNGYDSASAIMGFSFTHVTGTGGKSKYGNFRVTPTVGPLGVHNLVFAKSDETASPGYYAVTLGNRPEEAVRVELTASRLTGMMRVTYPHGQTHGNLILDATSIIALRGEGQRATASHVEVIDDHRVAGWAAFEGGWNPAPYKLYFYAEYDRPASDFGAWRGSQGALTQQAGRGTLEGLPQAKTAAAKSDLMVDYDTAQEFSHRLGTWAGFDTATAPQVRLKLAVSFISIDKARADLAAEMPGWDFDGARAKAADLWRRALDRIEVSGGSDDERRIFYTALYRSHTMPHDLSGENVWWVSTEPHYEDFYTLWDTFRTLHPLLTVIQPQRQRDMIRSLLDTYTHTGWLPDARIAGANGMTQGGSNGDVVIADAVVKGLGGFDVTLAYEALEKDGEVEAEHPFQEGRVLKDYLHLGYVPLTQARSASRTLEYAYDDFAIAQVARAVGNKADADRYLTRSAGWKKLWDLKLGCIRPRYPDGRWLENFTCTYDYPDKSTPWWEAPFYEGNSLQYSTYVPQDMPGLIAQAGGREAFVAWLDRLFDGGYYAQGNEPDILAPYLYIDAGRPDRTALRVRHILASQYGTSRDGLPGNDDAGAMSSWYVWSSIGLYPVAGQPVYYIGSPVFTRSVIHLEGGRTFTVSAPLASAANLYVQGARLNGRPIDRATLSHSELMRGGTLELDMGPAPSRWATASGDKK
jgi:predicted alpha-1,2-mannosidase